MAKRTKFARRNTCRRPFAPWQAVADHTARNRLAPMRSAAEITKPLWVWFILVALVNPAWAESAVFPKNRWFAVDALNGTNLRGKGLTLFVEPEGPSSAAFAKGFGGCNDWHSWFDTAGGTDVSFAEFTDTERVCSNQKRMQIEKDYLSALAKVTEFRFEGEMLSLSGEGVTLRLSPKK
jgi:heat shock protein HslJ